MHKVAVALPAITLRDVRKTYTLYPSVIDQAVDVLGFGRLMFWRHRKFPEYQALDGISLEIGQGELVGLIGRNGAGKTTLLKMIIGNFAPTQGSVEVNGSVQALMQVGLGFHPEFTGLENIRSSLLYNGLEGDQFEEALADVIDFVELGDFLNQPLKTYSLGMRSRLQFAAATAVRPEILVVDEVLGAGDAYFSAKSAARMKALTTSGCTLILVSHSTPQILQFCNRAVWLERGRVAMDGEALPVVKAYEEFNQKLQFEQRNDGRSQERRTEILNQVVMSQSAATTTDHTSKGGVSRWANDADGLIVERVRILGQDGQETAVVQTGDVVSIDIDVRAEVTGTFPCIFCIVLFTEDGRYVLRTCSPRYDVKLQDGERFTGRVTLEPLLLGNGSFCFSVAIYQTLDLRDLSSARFYDLLSRSFTFRVFNELPDDLSLIDHPAQWTINAPSTSDKSNGLRGDLQEC